jgi:hypothetical protein
MRVLAIALLAACGGHAEPDARPPDAPCGPECEGPMVLVTASWKFFPALGGPAGPCRAGVVNVEVYFETGEMAMFPCTASQGMTPVKAQGNQRVFARAVDATGAVVVASVPRVIAALDRASIEFYEDAGFVRVFPPAPACGSLVSPWPVLRLTDTAGTATTKVFQCETDADFRRGAMISPPLRPGSYQLAIAPDMFAPFVEHGMVVVETNDALTDVAVTGP